MIRRTTACGGGGAKTQGRPSDRSHGGHPASCGGLSVVVVPDHDGACGHIPARAGCTAAGSGKRRPTRRNAVDGPLRAAVVSVLTGGGVHPHEIDRAPRGEQHERHDRHHNSTRPAPYATDRVTRRRGRHAASEHGVPGERWSARRAGSVPRRSAVGLTWSVPPAGHPDDLCVTGVDEHRSGAHPSHRGLVTVLVDSPPQDRGPPATRPAAPTEVHLYAAGAEVCARCRRRPASSPLPRCGADSGRARHGPSWSRRAR